MMKRILAAAFALLLTVSQALAGFVINPYVFATGAAAPVLYAAACVANVNPLTQYTFSGVAITGLTDGQTVMVGVGIVGEDGATNFGVAGVTIEGAPATELADTAGVRTVSSAIYRSDLISNAASVNIVVDFTEPISGAAICVSALENLNSITPTDTTVGGASTEAQFALTLDPTTSGGFAIGICIAGRNDAGPNAWGVLTEREDINSTNFDYSNADGPTTGASMAVTCDFAGSGGGPTDGADAAFR